jgi:twitching motility protein PilT
MSDTLIINDILNAAAERKASDVHLIAGNSPVIRVDGRLTTLVDQPILTGDILSSLAESFLSKENFDRLSKEKEVVTIYNWADRNRYRAKVFYQKGFLAISLRLIAPFIRAPKDLGVPATILQLLNREKGLIIITGPFGSGRTATAVSLVETLNQNKGMHIQTLERPIEHLFSNNQSIIEQRGVGADVNSFVAGLKNMLDEDIDVVFIDSIHEDGAEKLILELAESGKLLIVIMGSDSVASALDKFISDLPSDKKDWGRDTLADVLLGAMAQRLIPRVGGGLTMASEVLVNNSAVRSSIRDDKLSQLSSIMQTSKEDGMSSLDKALAELVRVGEISIEDAKNQAVDSQNFR